MKTQLNHWVRLAAYLSVSIIISATLAACGFALRGTYFLPWTNLALDQSISAQFRAELKERIESSTTSKVVDDLEQAEALLFVAPIAGKDVLSLDSGGRVREYRLTGGYAYKIITKNKSAPGNGLTGTITLTRDLSYSDSETLAKQNEEADLRKEMDDELTRQLLRRLALIKTAKQTKDQAKDKPSAKAEKPAKSEEPEKPAAAK